jgi:recombination protein RecA
MARKVKLEIVEGEASIDDILAEIQESLNDEFGKDSAQRLNDESALSNVSTWCSTGSIIVDAVIAGGRTLPCSIIPFGRQVEIAGLPGSGKTTLCAQIAAQTQKLGGIVVMVDTEERVDSDYWTALGVDCSKIINLHGKTLEDVFTKQAHCIQLMQEKAPGIPLLMIWDSVGATSSDSVAMPNKDQSFMEAAEKNMGRDAKVIGAGMKVINKLVAESKCCYLYTNHVYNKVGVVYGAKTTTPGGEKLKFFATLRLELTRGQTIREEDEFGNEYDAGCHVWVKSNKNSMAPRLMKKEAIIIGGKGFSNEHSVFEAAKTLKLIETKGAWSSWVASNGEVKFQGLQGFFDHVVTHPDYQVLVDAVVASL